MSESKASSTRTGLRWMMLIILLSGGVSLWQFWPQLLEKLPFLSGGAQAPASSGAAPAAGPAGPGGPGGRPGGPGGPGAGLTPVRVSKIQQGRFDVYYKALGTVTPLNTVNVRSRVAGELVKIAFTEGQKVKAGDLLAVIDPRPYQIALSQAQGTLAQNRALSKNAQLNVVRYRKLHDEDSIAKQTLDTQQAEVDQYQGMLASNQAAVDEARLNLTYTEIRAPVEGRLGLKQLDVGNLLSANDATALVVITQTQPTNVVFTLPESDLMPVVTRFRKGEKLLVQAWDRGEKQQLALGELHSLDNQIDTTTGTLKLKARFNNEEELLLPNQFVNVRLRVETLPDAVLVPAAAVQYGSKGNFVYVVNDQSESSVRVLELGPSDGLMTVVKQGLQAGDRVVVEGTERLREGAKVEVLGDPALEGANRRGPRPEGGRPAGANGERPARTEGGERPATGPRAENAPRPAERPAQ